INEGTGQFNITFTGVSSGATNEAQTLSVTAISSNTAVVAIQSVSYLSPASSGTVRLRPGPSGTGTAGLALTVNDGGSGHQLFMRPFTLVVKPATNNLPTLSSIANQVINEDTVLGPINFTVGDVETTPANLTIRGTSSNPVLIPNQNITIGGSGAN